MIRENDETAADTGKVKIGYAISFTCYFYRPMPSLEEIRDDIHALERETEGVPGEIFGIEDR